MMHANDLFTENLSNSLRLMKYKAELVYASYTEEIEQIGFVVLATKLLSLPSIIYNP